MSSSPQDKPSLLVGIWFAAASCIPLSLVWIEFVFGALGKPWHALLGRVLGLCVLPILIAFVIGLWFGSDILEPDRVGTSGRAILRGGLVAMSSTLVYSLILGLFAGIWMSISERPPGNGPILDALQLFLVGLAGTLVLSLFTVGWIAVIVGAIAGWLLYKLRPHFHKGAT
ncbi:MAG: hypothetical protein ND895_22935 [Pyrinomonadaceae bacterium]|nr:hypothetical protein [Pyrinomonadaceae bacterium]